MKLVILIFQKYIPHKFWRFLVTIMDLVGEMHKKMCDVPEAKYLYFILISNVQITKRTFFGIA